MKRVMLAAFLVVSAAACGGSSAPKEFVFAIANPTTQAGPNAECNEAASQNVQVINFNSDGHVIVYQGDANTWFLQGPFGNNGAIMCRWLVDRGHTGWEYTSLANGLGRSLELINPALSNDDGQNWAASTVPLSSSSAPSSTSTRRSSSCSRARSLN